MTKSAITPIQAADLEEVGRFLHENLNRKISAERWRQSLTYPWCEERPNFGVQMRDEGRLVGVFCAIYSDQVIDGKPERFCNPHSWCVLKEYRNQSINLVLHLIRQPGYHFTMLTPNPKVAEIFCRLRFRNLDDRIAIFPNLPTFRALFGKPVVESDKDRIAALLEGPSLRDFQLHRDIPWLKFLVFGEGQDLCLIIYKTGRLKRLPGAILLHISDRDSFERQRPLMQHHFLLRRGLFWTRAEQRFLPAVPPLTYQRTRTQAKLYLSPTLRDDQIRDIYSELVALDL